jgi:hypothetical protein
MAPSTSQEIVTASAVLSVTSLALVQLFSPADPLGKVRRCWSPCCAGVTPVLRAVNCVPVLQRVSVPAPLEARLRSYVCDRKPESNTSLSFATNRRFDFSNS